MKQVKMVALLEMYVCIVMTVRNWISLEYQKKFNSYDGGYARLRSPEMITLKENANIKIIVDKEGHLLASACGNMLPSVKPYRQLSGISIQTKAKTKRKAYSSTNIINHILSTCRNCYLCKNNVIIDSEIARKIKRALSENITMEYKDEYHWY